MFLFFDLSYTPLLELHLPTAYIGETQNGFLSFYKKATPQVLESLANWQLSSAEKEALALVNNLQTNILYNKYAKKGETFEKLFQNPATKKYIQEQIEEQTHQLLLLIAEKELFLTINYSPKDDISKKRRFITKEILEPLLVFEKKEEGIAYRLYIEENGQKHLPHHAKLNCSTTLTRGLL
jgi:non-specific serine/threonine protein kinase